MEYENYNLPDGIQFEDYFELPYIKLEPCEYVNGSIPAWNKGIPKTQDEKQRISAAHKGKPKSEAHRAAMCKPKSRRPKKTEEHKRKIGLSKVGKKRISFACPHCNREIAAGNFNRWHGENCREKK